MHPWFADRYLVALDKRPKGDPLSNDQLSVSLEIALAIDGHIARIGVVRSSGIAEFDAAALESFARAAPFGPVPPAITSADGNVWMRWDMRRDEVFACSTMNARPYLVGP